MLRRPSDFFVTPREEGCSSTAFDPADMYEIEVWNNHANRGSSISYMSAGSAMP